MISCMHYALLSMQPSMKNLADISEPQIRPNEKENQYIQFAICLMFIVLFDHLAWICGSEISVKFSIIECSHFMIKIILHSDIS